MILRSAPGAPTLTVFGADAMDPRPRATELVATACTTAFAPRARPLAAPTSELAPKAVALGPIAFAFVPRAVA